MKRMASVLTLTAVLLALSSLEAAPASARIGRRAVVSCNGCWPTAFTFTPSGNRIYYVKRFAGEIRVKNLVTGENRLWATIGNLGTSGEQGVLGIALHPQWPDPAWVYVYYTRGTPLENRITRFRKRTDGSVLRENLVTVTAAGFHNGGVIHFGPNGLLYAVTGDAGDPARSQDTASNSGKVLRIMPGGAVPDDNPFPGEYTFSFGHRNSFGFTFDPWTGRLWQTENGEDCDEVNFARRGRNYGWGPPGDVADCPDTRGINPETFWGPQGSDIAPTGAAFCRQCRLGNSAGGRLLVGSWNDDKIRKLTLDAQRDDIIRRRLLYQNSAGVLAVEARPGGRVYFSDQNGIYRLVRV